MAEEIFNKKTSGEHHSFSAGTWVYDKEGISKHGTKLNKFEAAKEVLNSLREIGIDASQNSRDQLNEQMLDEADVVVVMAEEHTIPLYLKNNSKVRYWDVVDPKGMTQEETNGIRNQITLLIEKLITELNLSHS